MSLGLRATVKVLRARVNQGRMPVSNLPHRQRPLSHEHGERLGHLPSFEGLCAVDGTTHDTDLFRSICDGRPVLQ